jgi:predicted enzyme related to lactoylglutathione lyase
MMLLYREAESARDAESKGAIVKRPIGAPCWIDLLTSDAERAREFYAGMFGWTAGEAAEQFGGYFMFMRDDVPVAGCMQYMTGAPGMEGPDQWGVYLSAPDTKATVERALASGGALRVGPMDIADLGIEAIVADRAGARVGVWQANAFAGLAASDQPGAPVWFQLLTSDYTGAVGFYEDVFGWQTRVRSDTPEFRDTVLTAGGEDFAGIVAASDGDLAAGEPGRWEVFFRVADTDAALSTVVGLGGTVLRAAADTPFGRLAEAADPTGARFNLAG